MGESTEKVTCIHCGKEKAVGFVKTSSPTKSYSRDFRLCMPDIIDMEKWMEKKPNAKGQIPVMVFMSPEDAEIFKRDAPLRTIHMVKE
jgi:hypothetical protein